jgi:ankyrin repeat protein
MLIAKGADVNHKDSEGTPPLQNAVLNGDVPMVALLIKSGSNVKAKDQYGLSALVYALKGKSPEIVKMIKDAGGSY